MLSTRRVRLAASVVSLIALVAIACGSQSEPDERVGSTGSRIIGGKADTTDTFVVGIKIDYGGGYSALCSGTLIAPNLVLTARHCVSKTTKTIDCDPAGGLADNKIISNLAASAFTVTTNASYDGSPSWGVSAVRYVDDATCPSGSTVIACRLCGYDLALLELDGGSGAFPKDYAIPAYVGPKKGFKNYNAIGYGCQATEKDGCDPRGKRMLLENVDTILVDTENFAIDGRVCGGDSGGPVYDPKTNLVFGALSRGDVDCKQGVYTRTDFHMPWLQKWGKVAAADGGYAAPAWMTAPPPGPDAGPPKLSLGSDCTRSVDCASGVCVGDEKKRICSVACTDREPCPTGFACAAGYCWPAPPEPPSDDAGAPVGPAVDATTATTETVKSGCSILIVDPPRGTRSGTQLWAAALAFVAATAIRRRQR